jgi:pterin-4a-carbinolamine dehydratase
MTSSLSLLPEALIHERLARELPAWTLGTGHLQRELRTSGWPASLMVANAIAQLAEAAWHHPELHLAYASVGIRLSTHDAGGVTERDLALAARIEQVLFWPPSPGGPLTGAPSSSRLIVG